jgi:5-formyltetrahydrofolate cyclo-ligase
VKAEKRELRRRLREARRTLGADRASALSHSACERLAALPEALAARTVAVYSAHGGEIDPAVFAAACVARGVVVCYPLVRADEALSFHAVLPSTLAPGAIGIPEPPAGSPAVATDAIDLFVVPGVAFDLDGGRLGQGVAYYDRTLPLAPGKKVGLAYDFQVVPRVPMEPHDVRMDLVVTDRRVIVPGS